MIPGRVLSRVRPARGAADRGSAATVAARRDGANRESAATVACRVGNGAGQASVELVGALPLVIVVALAAFAVISAHAAGEQAGEAAEAGAVAILQNRDPRAAARAALPAAVRERAQIAVAGTRVDVRVRPRMPLPGLGDRLAATADADAGPGAATPARRSRP